ncbi:MAG: hypothetical protein IPK95_05610 [Cellvibrionales bacterium]|jgi:uncharacterized low-complexity protein|nr:hypothetical protein [Cellvibrionales bacterium]
MKIQNRTPSALFAAVTLAGAITVPLANAASNPFSNTELSSGFNLEHAAETKTGGEGKCGDASKCPEGKCGEGKCGEQCANKEQADDKVISDDKSAEGKCGEGKCGESHKAEDASKPQP